MWLISVFRCVCLSDWLDRMGSNSGERRDGERACEEE